MNMLRTQDSASTRSPLTRQKQCDVGFDRSAYEGFQAGLRLTQFNLQKGRLLFALSIIECCVADVCRRSRNWMGGLPAVRPADEAVIDPVQPGGAGRAKRAGHSNDTGD